MNSFKKSYKISTLMRFKKIRFIEEFKKVYFSDSNKTEILDLKDFEGVIDMTLFTRLCKIIEKLLEIKN